MNNQEIILEQKKKTSLTTRIKNKIHSVGEDIEYLCKCAVKIAKGIADCFGIGPCTCFFGTVGGIVGAAVGAGLVLAEGQDAMLGAALGATCGVLVGGGTLGMFCDHSGKEDCSGF